MAKKEETRDLGKKAMPSKLPPGMTLDRTLRGHTTHIRCIVWSPDGRMLASSAGKAIRLRDAETGEWLRVLEGHTGFG